MTLTLTRDDFAHPRCLAFEKNGKTHRQCVRDAGHNGQHEFGSWIIADPPQNAQERRQS